MCIYVLGACPYPHHDPIIPLVFDPIKLEQWQTCDLTKPWGSLSCGDLSIHHHSAASLVINPASEKLLENRQRGQPLSIQPRVELTDSASPRHDNSRHSASLSAKCLWCTLVLQLHAHKFKSVKEIRQTALAKMEGDMDQNSELRILDRDINIMEAKLLALRQRAWQIRTTVMQTEHREGITGGHDGRKQLDLTNGRREDKCADEKTQETLSA